MSLTYQPDQSMLRKSTYSKIECLHILEFLSYQRDQIDTFGNRLRQVLICCCRLFSKNFFSQKFETPIPPRKWIDRMTKLVKAVEGSDMSAALHSADCKRIWADVSTDYVSGVFSGRVYCDWDFYSFLSNTKA